MKGARKGPFHKKNHVVRERVRGRQANNKELEGRGGRNQEKGKQLLNITLKKALKGRG